MRFAVYASSNAWRTGPAPVTANRTRCKTPCLNPILAPVSRRQLVWRQCHRVHTSMANAQIKTPEGSSLPGRSQIAGGRSSRPPENSG